MEESRIRKTLRAVTNPLWCLSIFIVRNPWLIKDDETYLRWYYYHAFRHWMDFENPKTFNQKMQWLKIHNRRPEMIRMVDKSTAKDYVAEKLGTREYLIPTLGMWDTFEEIDFESLPQHFVLKCTHDSGGVVVCRDKAKFDATEARRKLTGNMQADFYGAHREWPYKDVRPRIIAEEYLDNGTGDLPDYKFFCYNGEVKYLLVTTNRSKGNDETRYDFFDAEYNHLPVHRSHPNSEITPTRPKSFEKMKELASVLSEGIPFIRVDFYEKDGKPYFGELTFFSNSGAKPFYPDEWDRIFGEPIDLSLVK